MECLSKFRKRVGANGVYDTRSKLTYQAKREFERLLKVDPCALDVKVTDVGEVNISDSTKTIRVVINDVSDNDQRAFDEKWLFVKYEDNVDLGCYVWWDKCYWLVSFKEHNTMDSYKKFIMKKCNQIIKFVHDGVIYEIPIVVKNLTQYSDGLQDIVYTSMPDNKLSFTYGINFVTENIMIGSRVMVNRHNPYRVTMVEDYQYNSTYDKEDGIASAIAVYTAMRDTDDANGNLADNNIENSINGLTIVGMDSVMPGGKFKYSLSETKYSEWKIDYIGNKNGYVSLKRSGDDCILDIKADMGLIGSKFKLISLNGVNLPQTEKEIIVSGF